MSKTIDVTGLPESAVLEIQKRISSIRGTSSRNEPEEKVAPPLTPVEKLALFEQWLAGHAPSPVVADDSRESIYAGRGE